MGVVSDRGYDACVGSRDWNPNPRDPEFALALARKNAQPKYTSTVAKAGTAGITAADASPSTIPAEPA